MRRECRRMGVVGALAFLVLVAGGGGTGRDRPGEVGAHETLSAWIEVDGNLPITGDPVLGDEPYYVPRRKPPLNSQGAGVEAFCGGGHQGQGEYDWDSDCGTVEANGSTGVLFSTGLPVVEDGTVRVTVSEVPNHDPVTAWAPIQFCDTEIDSPAIADALEDTSGIYLGVGCRRKQISLLLAPGLSHLPNPGHYPDPWSPHNPHWLLTLHCNHPAVEAYATQDAEEPMTELAWGWEFVEGHAVPDPPYWIPGTWQQLQQGAAPPTSFWIGAPRTDPQAAGVGAISATLEIRDSYHDFDVEDTIKVSVVILDIEAGGLNEEEEEDPGLWINANWDDDDGDGWKVGEVLSDEPPDAQYTGDLADEDGVPAGDDDLRSCVISLGGVQAPAGLVNINYPRDKIRVWRARAKYVPDGQGGFESTEAAFVEASELPLTVYVEGVGGSEEIADVTLSAQWGVDLDISDAVKVTVVEVDSLKGFYGVPLAQAQQPPAENTARHSAFGGSSDMNGRISWDDANGDGIVGDEDPNCDGFHNCMELQGTVRPSGLPAGDPHPAVTLDIKRDVYGRTWRKPNGQPWETLPAGTFVPWADDDGIETDEDRDPRPANHIYHIDGPGAHAYGRGGSEGLARFRDFREWVEVSIDGNVAQCSNFKKWHSAMYLKAKDEHHFTRDYDEAQLLGDGWVEIPQEP